MCTECSCSPTSEWDILHSYSNNSSEHTDNTHAYVHTPISRPRLYAVCKLGCVIHEVGFTDSHGATFIADKSFAQSGSGWNNALHLYLITLIIISICFHLYNTDTGEYAVVHVNVL